MYGRMDGYMYDSLVPELLDGFYSYPAIIGLSMIGQCPVNTNIPAQKREALQISPKK
jgi:hypothetical protein